MQIYEKEDDLEELIKGIKNGLLPIVPTNLPKELRELLISCMQQDQELRPSFTHICNKLDSIIDSRPDISTEIFKEYKTKITSEISDKMSQKIAYMKKEADKSDPEMTTNDQTRYTIDDLLNRIHDDIKKNDQEYKCNRKKAEDMSFIFTEGSEERFNKLYYCIKFGIPVLLEGPTGTSKTLSSRIVCQILHRELIYFNLSPKTTIHDLLGNYAGDKNSLAEINQKDGPFFTAFTQGKVILLDEINLASPSVLQFIENALENEILSIETPEKSLKFVKMHPNFRIIAIQKITKWQSGLLQQSLSFKFISKFLTISYPAFTEDELLFIGKSFAERFGYKRLEIVEDLVKYHKELSENPLFVDEILSFTIREITATIRALSENFGINDTIMTIYGARYHSQKKSQLKNILLKNYPRLTQND